MGSRRRPTRLLAGCVLAAATALASWSAPVASQERTGVLTDEQWVALPQLTRGLLTSLASLEPVDGAVDLVSVLPGADPVNGRETSIEYQAQSAFLIDEAPVDGSSFADLVADVDTLFLPASDAYFANSPYVVFNHFVVSDPLAGLDTQVEFGLFESIDDQPTFPPTEGFVTPDSAATRAVALLYKEEVPEPVFVLGTQPGQPFTTPFAIVQWTGPTPFGPDDKTHVLFLTENPNARTFPTLTFATDPLDPATYRFRQLTGPATLTFELPTVAQPQLEDAVRAAAPALNLPPDLEDLFAGAVGTDPGPIDEIDGGDGSADAGGGGDAVVSDEVSSEPADGSDDSGGLPAWLLAIIGVTVLAAVTAAVKVGPLRRRSPTLTGDYANDPSAETMGDPAYFLLRDARTRGLPMIDGKQKVEFGRASGFVRVSGGNRVYEPDVIDMDMMDSAETLTLGPRPAGWDDMTATERFERFAYWVDPETMTMTIGGLDHPELDPGPPEYSPETDGPDPVGMDGDMPAN